MGQSDQNIPELVLRAKSGDQQAMEQLYEMTYSRVLLHDSGYGQG